MLHFTIIIAILTYYMARKDARKPIVEEFYDVENYVVLDSQLWFMIESRRGEIPRDEFIAKILSHGLGSSYNGFGVES